MNCDEIKELLPDYLASELAGQRLHSVREHLASCPDCATEAKQIGSVWSALGDLPEEIPPANARARFDTMLDAYSQGQRSVPGHAGLLESLNRTLMKIWPSRPVLQVAAGLFLLVVGAFSGRLIEVGNRTDMAALQTEMIEMRQLLTVTLMNQSSAIDRLQGVVMSRALQTTDSNVASALIKRLNDDPNVSVRLAAAEALGQYRDQGWVRTELVSSLSRQTSPLVQVSLMELLMYMKEKQAVDAFEEIIGNEETMEPVRKMARIGLENLI
jgi:hypothetical protein